ncbi:g-type lectin s-receptor-like serine/threonine-protein kinase ces101 [Quercus suber]|uniref:G-type lectin s-receptor-like serine/threonine-protein kinase ces101 n=1 Tax=Quercus suber TaxID=58331 RepID=A0AAW0LUM6_QUESU
MANKIRKLILGLLSLLFYLGPSSSLQHDTLVQGQELEFLAELYSASGKFKIGFFDLTSGPCYIGIWYNDNRFRENNTVWVANRDNPVTPGSLTIDDNRNLKITYNGDQLVIMLHGEIYWTSGYVNSSSFRLTNSNYSFDYTSNENETYFSYSAADIYSPQLSINYLGVLSDDKGVIVDCTSASSYLNEGCVAKEKCGSLNETFSRATQNGKNAEWKGREKRNKNCSYKKLEDLIWNQGSP